MFVSANAAVVRSKVIDVVPGLGATMAARRAGVKSRSRLAVAMTFSCCE
jgi:hypothetical protein